MSLMWEGRVRPLAPPLVKVAAASPRVTVQLLWIVFNRLVSGASLPNPGRENSSCWLSWSGSPVDFGGLSASVKALHERGLDQLGRVPRSLHVCHVMDVSRHMKSATSAVMDVKLA